MNSVGKMQIIDFICLKIHIFNSKYLIPFITVFLFLQSCDKHLEILCTSIYIQLQLVHGEYT